MPVENEKSVNERDKEEERKSQATTDYLESLHQLAVLVQTLAQVREQCLMTGIKLCASSHSFYSKQSLKEKARKILVIKRKRAQMREGRFKIQKLQRIGTAIVDTLKRLSLLAEKDPYFTGEIKRLALINFNLSLELMQ